MTAELSQLFRTKRNGVEFVIAAFESTFPDSAIHLFGVDGAFLPPAAARANPLIVAASNWAASAAIVSHIWPNSVLIDVGTTTTDIIPLQGGKVVARGRSDPERLLTGELLYLGTVRTAVEAIVNQVPFGGGMAGVSAESFALAGDVHLWRGDIGPDEYTTPTPDGRPATREAARDRLARVICADGEMLDDCSISAIADHVAAVQIERTARSIERVLAHHSSVSLAVTVGIGAFLARRAAHRLGLASVGLDQELGPLAARSAPAAAVALLLERELTD